MQSLLTKYNLASFDYIKLDIEGSEWQLFRQDVNLGWLSGVKLMSLEVSMLSRSGFHPRFTMLLVPSTQLQRSFAHTVVLLLTRLLRYSVAEGVFTMAMMSRLSFSCLSCVCPTHLRESIVPSASTAMQVHPYKALPGDEDHLVTALKSRGYDMSKHGEYEVWASQDLHPFLRPKQTPPALLPI